MKRRKRERGFVLLIVLLVLVVCGTVLTATARRCVQNAMSSADAQRVLQLNWGTLSCRDAVLPKAELILQESQAPEAPILSEARRSVTLGGMKFNLVVSDESAKANVNVLGARGGDPALTTSINRLQGESLEMLPVRLQPRKDFTLADLDAPNGEIPERYASFDQVFQIGHPSELISPSKQEVAPARRRLTCWGGGKVNFRRAEVPVMKEVLEGCLSESQLAAVVELRGTQPDLTVPQLFAQLQLTDEQMQTAAPVVTDESECHSLWVIVEGKTRNWYRLYVERADQAGNEWGRSTFVW